MLVLSPFSHSSNLPPLQCEQFQGHFLYWPVTSVYVFLAHPSPFLCGGSKAIELFHSLKSLGMDYLLGLVNMLSQSYRPLSDFASCA